MARKRRRGFGRVAGTVRAIALRRLTIAAAFTAVSFTLAACGGGEDEDRPASDGPNIVVIQTDDQVLSTFTPEVLPNVHELIVDGGTSFTNYIATTPLCCPSRSTLLTGQYAHNHGVRVNRYELLRDKENVLPAWLQAAGYTTAHVGKFLNGYKDAVENNKEVAPGWDRWVTLLDPERYYNYKLSVDGEKKEYGEEDGDYLGRTLTSRSVDLIEELSSDEAPFYLQVDYLAPHIKKKDGRECADAEGPEPDPEDYGLFEGETAPRSDSFNEEDTSDKPGFLADEDPLTEAEIAAIDERWRCYLQALQSVDRGTAQIVRALESTGELENTVLVFLSDNGEFFGEHRLFIGKGVGYVEAIHMPLAVKLPESLTGGEPQPAQAPLLAGNIDLAPTFLEIAGGAPCIEDECRTMDGVSLLDVALGEGEGPRRDFLLVEGAGCAYRSLYGPEEQFIRSITQRIPNREDVKCVDGADTEYYDLTEDPLELENLTRQPAGPDRARIEELAALLAEMERCAGVEGRDEAVGGAPFCS